MPSSIRWWYLGALLAAIATMLGLPAWQSFHGGGSNGTRAAGLPSTTAATAYRWSSYEKLFAANSPWNSRPVDAVLGDYVIPKSDYHPMVAEGAWSTGVFLAKAGDPPVVVKGRPGTAGVWDPDSDLAREVEIPRWPAEVEPAVESDGHCEIVDPILGVVHSFWQLKKIDGRWTAALYAWAPLDGRGWGDPAHFYQGARAAAVPSSGGLIRKHELDDGDALYRHALAMSLTFNALSADPTYVFPATSADNDAATTNSGRIPEGALLMLPPSFDTQKIATPSLRKIAETLKVYGAYVVDRNLGTPYSIYVETGSGFAIHRGGWNVPASDDLETIRLGLREVVSSKGWVDGDGKAFAPERNLNMLSMRGPWRAQSGKAVGRYDTWKQAVVFEQSSPQATVLVNDSGRSMQAITWATPSPGASYRVTSIAEGGAKLRIQLRSKADARVRYDSGELADGQSAVFDWPADCVIATFATSGIDGPSSVRGRLVAASR